MGCLGTQEEKRTNREKRRKRTNKLMNNSQDRDVTTCKTEQKQGRGPTDTAKMSTAEAAMLRLCIV